MVVQYTMYIACQNTCKSYEIASIINTLTLLSRYKHNKMTTSPLSDTRDGSDAVNYLVCESTLATRLTRSCTPERGNSLQTRNTLTLSSTYKLKMMSPLSDMREGSDTVKYSVCGSSTVARRLRRSCAPERGNRNTLTSDNTCQPQSLLSFALGVALSTCARTGTCACAS